MCVIEQLFLSIKPTFLYSPANHVSSFPAGFRRGCATREYYPRLWGGKRKVRTASPVYLLWVACASSFNGQQTSNAPLSRGQPFIPLTTAESSLLSSWCAQPASLCLTPGIQAPAIVLQRRECQFWARGRLSFLFLSYLFFSFFLMSPNWRTNW